MSQFVSTRCLDTVFAHIYKRSCLGDHNSDIWTVSLNWPVYREKLRDALLSGTYRLSPLSVYTNQASGTVSRWSSKECIAYWLCLVSTWRKIRLLSVRLKRGFDFLGYRFSSQDLVGLAGKAIANFTERLGRLYESGASTTGIAQYVRHWQRWCSAGL